MFDIDHKPTFITEVTVRVPSSPAPIEQTFAATFAAIDIPELEAFDLADPAGAKAFCERVLVNASGVSSGGKEVSFSTAVRDALIGKSWVRQALIDAYVAGLAKAAKGN